MQSTIMIDKISAVHMDKFVRIINLIRVDSHKSDIAISISRVESFVILRG
jgi:hypothetical protein